MGVFLENLFSRDLTEQPCKISASHITNLKMTNRVFTLFKNLEKAPLMNFVLDFVAMLLDLDEQI